MMWLQGADFFAPFFLHLLDMIFKENPKRLGKIIKVHGVHGAMVVACDRTLQEVSIWPEWVFLEIEGGLVPFKITSEDCFVKDSHTLVLFLATVNNKESATRMVNTAVWFPENWMSQDPSTSWELSDLPGYSVVAEGMEGSGTVEEWIDIPENPLLKIIWEGQEILLPAQPAFIVDWSEAKRSLTIKIPAGLLDLD